LLPKLTNQDEHYEHDNVGEIHNLIKIYSCSICRPFVEEVQGAFPREIRDMIWLHLCDSENGAAQQIDDALLEYFKEAATTAIKRQATYG
jgi:hypothetical protein